MINKNNKAKSKLPKLKPRQKLKVGLSTAHTTPHLDQIKGWAVKPEHTFEPKFEKKAVVIFSGGLDSTVLLYGLVRDGYIVHALSFDYGQRFKRELEVSKEIIKDVNSQIKAKTKQVVHKIVSVSDLSKIYESIPLIGQKKIKFPTVKPEDSNLKIYSSEDGRKRANQSKEFSTIPFRNAIFLSIAVAYAQSIKFNGVWYAAHRSLLGTVFPDCTDNFVKSFEATAIHGTANPDMRIFAPFLNMTKDEIIAYSSDKINSKKLKVPLEKTYSCYAGTKLNCGECNNCVPRIEAFKRSGVTDLTPYDQDKKVRKLKQKVKAVAK